MYMHDLVSSLSTSAPCKYGLLQATHIAVYCCMQHITRCCCFFYRKIAKGGRGGGGEIEIAVCEGAGAYMCQCICM